jgi:glycosyltransferase involved in cell wall biosynthesis
MIYRHVDMLNAAGIQARVVHQRRGFACSWFAHDTAIECAGDVVLGREDVLVVPEIYGPELGRLPAGIRLVINNQNAYNTFDGIPVGADQAGLPYGGSRPVEAVIVPSLDNAELLRYAFPGLRVERVRCGIDTRTFRPGPTPARRIAVMPRKRERDVRQVLHLLHARSSLEGWEIVIIDGNSETETAALLASSAIFLSLSEAEGFGLPPAEAMASGCYVVGYTGMAGREFFRPEFCTPIADGDILAFARATAELLDEYGRSPARLRGAGLASAAHIEKTYSIEAQGADLVDFFSSITQERVPGREI